MRKMTMRKNWSLSLAAILALAMAAQIGCNGDDDPVEPDPCSLTVTTPATGAEFKTDPQEIVGIRWTATGTATAVKIELLQGGVSVGEIAAMADNDGYHPWTAAVMGGTGGNDFSVRLTALGQSGCGAESGQFTILDTAACDLDLTNAITSGTTLTAGQPLTITWDGSNTTGQVALELWHGHINAVLVGTIAAPTDDDGTHEWIVDSFNDAAHRTVTDPSVYWLKISDDAVPACRDSTENFILEDDTVLSLDVYVSPTLASLTIGQSVTVNFFTVGYSETGETVRIALYAGSIAVPGAVLATNLAASAHSFQWTVDDFGFIGGNPNFKIRVTDTQDSTIWGESDKFSIVE